MNIDFWIIFNLFEFLYKKSSKLRFIRGYINGREIMLPKIKITQPKKNEPIIYQ